MGVAAAAIWLDQAISGALRAAEIRCDGYKMGIKFVVGDDNQIGPKRAETTDQPSDAEASLSRRPLRRALPRVGFAAAPKSLITGLLRILPFLLSDV